MYECPYSREGQLLTQERCVGRRGDGLPIYEGGISKEEARKQLGVAYFDPMFYERVIVLKRNGLNAKQIMDDLIKHGYLLRAKVQTHRTEGSPLPIGNLFYHQTRAFPAFVPFDFSNFIHIEDYYEQLGMLKSDASCVKDGPDLIMVFGTRNETISNKPMVLQTIAILAGDDIREGSRIARLDMDALKYRPLRHAKLSANTTVKDGFIVATKDIPALAVIDMRNISEDLCNFEMFSTMMLDGIRENLAEHDVPAMMKAGFGWRLVTLQFDPADYALRKRAVKRGLEIMQDQRRSAAIKESLDPHLPSVLIDMVKSYDGGYIVDLSDEVEVRAGSKREEEKERPKKQDRILPATE